MNATEAALRERIKELTCLYEVSSIIVNANSTDVKKTFKAIALSLKKGFEFPSKTGVLIKSSIEKTSILTKVLGCY